MKFLNLWLVAALLALCTCATPSPVPSEAAQSELTRTGKLRFGVVAGLERTEFFVVRNADGQPEGVPVYAKASGLAQRAFDNAGLTSSRPAKPDSTAPVLWSFAPSGTPREDLSLLGDAPNFLRTLCRGAHDCGFVGS